MPAPTRAMCTEGAYTVCSHAHCHMPGVKAQTRNTTKLSTRPSQRLLAAHSRQSLALYAPQASYDCHVVCATTTCCRLVQLLDTSRAVVAPCCRCTNHGNCNGEKGTCDCPFGYGGASCGLGGWAMMGCAPRGLLAYPSPSLLPPLPCSPHRQAPTAPPGCCPPAIWPRTCPHPSHSLGTSSTRTASGAGVRAYGGRECQGAWLSQCAQTHIVPCSC